jgi:myo-inositol catabolism protein IolC
MTTWRPTRTEPLLILAMDHRASFAKTLFGVKNDAPDDAQRAAMEGAKRLSYDGLRRAYTQLTRGRPGVLTDQRYGQSVIDAAAHDPVVLAVPIERSGRDWFELEFGDQWLERFQASGAGYAKVLVRDNPAFDADQRAGQQARLRQVSEQLHKVNVPLLYELLVPATDDQKASVAGSTDAYDRDLRPGLVVQVVKDHQYAGIEPTIWKIEGLETAEAARAVIAQIRIEGRTDVDAIVLGRDAPAERLDHWLDVAADVDGFVGFAIGRSIWEDPTQAHIDGTVTDADTIAAVAANYLRFANRYLDALPV